MCISINKTRSYTNLHSQNQTILRVETEFPPDSKPVSPTSGLMDSVERTVCPTVHFSGFFDPMLEHPRGTRTNRRVRCVAAAVLRHFILLASCFEANMIQRLQLSAEVVLLKCDSPDSAGSFIELRQCRIAVSAARSTCGWQCTFLLVCRPESDERLNDELHPSRGHRRSADCIPLSC